MSGFTEETYIECKKYIQGEYFKNVFTLGKHVFVNYDSKVIKCWNSDVFTDHGWIQSSFWIIIKKPQMSSGMMPPT